jgi:hypothetical protein
MIVNVSSVLFVYLFQENKSYGSKKPIYIHPLMYKKSCQAQLVTTKISELHNIATK